ncbi:restriction endonuclease (plasmid) [Methylosinus trichosporium OB3b]|uniref:Restriction endonuclease n=1 Tax=Methylosinus trichosporium (strain ATCC 35070 / NCIMB 11131 / UNIQEM 75 / OB3b) TaxID=595536 RepID=A0A2D2D6Z4_METT3|nr:restriction endonuclease [Methylosinus trichosporium]ATQ70743.1 restriction endonuclease [Methylosinus trichosporium OB3b]
MELPHDLERLIQDALAELGIKADSAKIAHKVKLLNLGLPAEDQFQVICAWLGKCDLIHKLDQVQAPLASRQTYQVPDLLAHFQEQGAFLIEVKVFGKQTLSLRADYLARLKAYATLVSKPLLIAWTFHGLWTLFDARHLKLAKTNFNIKHSEAMRQSLLGVLAGDCVFKLAPGAGVHFEMSKDALEQVEETDTRKVETWRMHIAKVGFTKGGGLPAANLHPETRQLLVAWDLEVHDDHHPDHIDRHFVVGDEGMQFAHMALVQLLAWERGADRAQDWRQILRAPEITKTIVSFSAALDRALAEGVVSHIFHLQPNDWGDLRRPAKQR